MAKVQYIEYAELECRGPVDPAPSREVSGLLVGTEPVLKYYGNQSSYGEDYIKVFPAFYAGKRAWLRRLTWCPVYGYNASGVEEEIISFEEGVKLFLERGVFAFPEP